jgi:predicted nucleic acid-binding protein
MLTQMPAGVLATTDFVLHSVGLWLCPSRGKEFRLFLDDIISRRVNTLHLPPSDLYRVLDVMAGNGLDFDDAFQYVAAERFNLQLVSFDADFDNTPRGRMTPAQALIAATTGK